MHLRTRKVPQSQQKSNLSRNSYYWYIHHTVKHIRTCEVTLKVKFVWMTSFTYTWSARDTPMTSAESRTRPLICALSDLCWTSICSLFYSISTHELHRLSNIKQGESLKLCFSNVICLLSSQLTTYNSPHPRGNKQGNSPRFRRYLKEKQSDLSV